jgi:hypothetical protein
VVVPDPGAGWSVDSGIPLDDAPRAAPSMDSGASQAVTPDLDANIGAVDTSSFPVGVGSDANTDPADASPGGGGPVDAAPMGTTLPVPGEVFITEVMFDPMGLQPQLQWIELYNATPDSKLLSGLTLLDGHGTKHTIQSTSPITIDSHSYVLIARNKADVIAATRVPASAVVYEHGPGIPKTAGILLSASAAGGISLLNGAMHLADVPYGPWVNGGSLGSRPSAGRSIERKMLTPPSSTSGAADWCVAPKAWASKADYGTPAAANDCP